MSEKSGGSLDGDTTQSYLDNGLSFMILMVTALLSLTIISSLMTVSLFLSVSSANRLQDWSKLDSSIDHYCVKSTTDRSLVF
jgi:hypothetical protein